MAGALVVDLDVLGGERAPEVFGQSIGDLHGDVAHMVRRAAKRKRT
jgi:hypothetical protein